MSIIKGERELAGEGEAQAGSNMGKGQDLVRVRSSGFNVAQRFVID